MSYGARYLSARQGAADHRLACAIAADSLCGEQSLVSARAASFHDRRAEQVRSELVASRKLGLRGTAGQLPRNYHGDSQVVSANPHSAIRTPQS